MKIKNMNPFDVKPFDKEERQLIETIENGETVPAENQKQLIKDAVEAAENTLSKNKNINIRISGRDISKIKEKAAEAGLPYQTLIASILHQYANEKIKIEI